MEETPKNDSGKSAAMPKVAGGGLSTPVWAGIAVACAVVGILIGKFLLGGASGGGLVGKTKVSESELNSAMATYTYAGATNTISIRDVITSSSSLDSAKNEDGTYNVPSADGALSVARSAIIEKEAEKRGLAVTDDEVTAYAKEMIGSDDIESIASSYGMDADTAKKLIKQSAMMKKLRDDVVSSDAGEAPTAPTTPADDQKQTPTAEYAQYIIKLAGDEWDSANNTWKSADGPYATALASFTVSNDAATYEAAQAAYYVAYQDYSTKQSAVSTEWTNFVNGLLSNATINLSTLTA